jgi:D-alanyl-lipoteichoic acid acyltransferase DltB (MBOAT superfamily)
MLFNSTIFILLFLPPVLAAYYMLAGNRRARLALLSLASLAFYGYWDVRFVPLLAGSAVGNWLLVQVFARHPVRHLPLLGVALNLLLLCVFKYTNFLASTLAAVADRPFRGFDIILPIGISFFTFQQVSYLMDLKRGKAPIYGFQDYFLFITFFPQLIAGPIVRHHEIIPQYDRDPRRAETWENLSRGALLFLIGLCKKVVLADQLALIADPFFEAARTGQVLNLAEAWSADLAYTLQIYFDFSGYSDMAIGLGLMCGFRLPVNFDAPYRAASIQEFWRRWHMTLSRFLRDYVYISLGGNRRGRMRQAANVAVTFLLGGLWHGAAWTFVAWGGLHALALAASGLWRRYFGPLPRALGWALTLLFVMVAWVVFRAADFATAASVLRSMAGANGLGPAALEDGWLLAFGSGVALLGMSSHRILRAHFQPRWWVAVPAAGVLVFVLLMIGGSPQNEFIYFQF